MMALDIQSVSGLAPQYPLLTLAPVDKERGSEGNCPSPKSVSTGAGQSRGLWVAVPVLSLSAVQTVGPLSSRSCASLKH